MEDGGLRGRASEQVAGPAVVTLAAGSRSGLRNQSEVWYYRVPTALAQELKASRDASG